MKFYNKYWKKYSSQILWPTLVCEIKVKVRIQINDIWIFKPKSIIRSKQKDLNCAKFRVWLFLH